MVAIRSGETGMVTTVSARTGLEQPRLTHELRCPACGRFLAALVLPTGVQAGQSWIRVRCMGCRKFVTIDPTTKQSRHGVD